MFCAVLSLGSNLGAREENLRDALKEICAQVDLLSVSKIYETPAVGYENQGNFLNVAIAINTVLQPEELLELCQNIEIKFGRERSFKNAPRTLDIDIIFFDDLHYESETLTIPHPRWQARDFVITPLLDLLDEGVFNESHFEMLRLFLNSKSRNFQPHCKL